MKIFRSKRDIFTACLAAVLPLHGIFGASTTTTSPKGNEVTVAADNTVAIPGHDDILIVSPIDQLPITIEPEVSFVPAPNWEHAETRPEPMRATFSSTVNEFVIEVDFETVAKKQNGDPDDSETVTVRLLKVDLESDKAASGSYLPEDVRIDPVILRNPQSFGEIADDDIDPCDRQREDPALVVFYEDVVDDDYNIEDFDVELNAGTDGLVDVFQWSKVKGPDSGTLTDANKSNAIYSDPKVGGLYQFDVDLGGQSIRTSLLLPLAGADITDWLEAEAASMGPWARAHLRATEEANYSSKPFVTRYAVFRTWITISGAFFDYTLDSADANELSPCRRYQSDISDEAEYGYLTVSGVVVHGSKINLALWSLFRNHWGYSQYELAAGGHLNQIMTRFSLDPVSSTEAIGLGSQMFLFPNTSMDSSGRINHLRRMQSDNDLIEEKLWPSPYPMDPSKSDMSRPDSELPTTPNPGSDQPPF